MYWILSGLVTFVVALLSPAKIYRWIYILIRTLPRDIRLMAILLKTYLWAKECRKNNYTLSTEFSKFLKQHPKKVAFHFEDEAWTFEKVEEFSNKIANYFDAEGYQKGDKIALLLENCIEYPSIWFGLSKNGIVTALINTNLVKGPLLHTITVANCKAIIFGSSHIQALSDISENLGSKKLYQLRNKHEQELVPFMGSIDLELALSNVPGKIACPKELSNLDPVLFIYTSGTTGNPKAAVITHIKVVIGLKGLNNLAGIAADDVMYTALPLYHTSGCLIAVGQVFLAGLTVVVRKKFSATNYFKDCAKYKVTVAQYLGEICRYLLATPPDQSEKYQVKTFIGSGFKRQIWKQFVERFGVKRVVELYGATEGIAILGNIDGQIGAVGFIPRYLKWIFPITNIRCDEMTGEPVRDNKGYCIECGVGEAGVIIAKIDSIKAMLSFDGYSDEQATNTKILRNVFRKGDTYFNSGDILEYDEFGYLYFKDRTGDTFRWKSENVSTAEIEAVISNMVQLSDVLVYGVKVPHTDGRAGMAAVVDSNRNIDIQTFGNLLKANLPSYAIPVFLRIMDSAPLTSTFKLKKYDLREEAFDINKIKDELYFYHPKFGRYVPLTKDIYEEIHSGTVRI